MKKVERSQGADSLTRPTQFAYSSQIMNAKKPWLAVGTRGFTIDIDKSQLVDIMNI